MIARTERERAVLREGGKRLATILRTLALEVRPGISTEDLDEKARALLSASGDRAAFLGYRPEGAPRPYPAALCISVNDVIQHGIPNEHPRIIKDGDLITLDMGLVHDGLITDSAVSVIAGTADSEDRSLIEAVEEALAAGIREAKTGNTTGHIGAAIESVGKKYGLKFPPELAGHGVGKRVHEEPYVPNYGTPGEGDELVEGLVIAIEPMFTRGGGAVKLDSDGYTYRTKDGSRSAHAEHTVIVGALGPEVLTRI